MKQPSNTPVAGAPPPTATANRPADYAIYKPNSRGTGGVIRFEINRAKGSVFVDAALQFDWA